MSIAAALKSVKDVLAPDRVAEDVANDAFRAALRQLAGAVSVIATGEGAGRAGLTATSVTSLAIEPPTVLVTVNRAASAYPTLIAEARFSINLLSDKQQAIADRFAGRGGINGGERFVGADWTTLITGAPVLVGALATIDCELDEVIERHSHGILIGRVKAVALDAEAGALLYWRAGYERLGDLAKGADWRG